MTLNLPTHKGELSITHNQHKSNYVSVREHLGFSDHMPEDLGISTDEYAALCAGDELWEIQWYPDTPVGFYYVAAATLERALELANSGASAVVAREG